MASSQRQAIEAAEELAEQIDRLLAILAARDDLPPEVREAIARALRSLARAAIAWGDAVWS